MLAHTDTVGQLAANRNAHNCIFTLSTVISLYLNTALESGVVFLIPPWVRQNTEGQYLQNLLQGKIMHLCQCESILTERGRQRDPIRKRQKKKRQSTGYTESKIETRQKGKWEEKKGAHYVNSPGSNSLFVE